MGSMAFLWIQQAREGADEWGVLPLAHPVVLTGDRSTPVRRASGLMEESGAAVLAPRDNAGDAWALVCAPGACRVNGEPVKLAIRCLADKDEILLPGGVRFYFTTERVARVEPFREGS